MLWRLSPTPPGTRHGVLRPDLPELLLLHGLEFRALRPLVLAGSTNTDDNRIATFTGGTTQGLTKDPGDQDHLGQLNINNIFEELDNANVSWKIYYTVTDGYCLDYDDCPDTSNSRYPASTFESLSYSYQYISAPELVRRLYSSEAAIERSGRYHQLVLYRSRAHRAALAVLHRSD